LESSLNFRDELGEPMVIVGLVVRAGPAGLLSPCLVEGLMSPSELQNDKLMTVLHMGALSRFERG
jgi:hypothetical protein